MFIKSYFCYLVLCLWLVNIVVHWKSSFCTTNHQKVLIHTSSCFPILLLVLSLGSQKYEVLLTFIAVPIWYFIHQYCLYYKIFNNPTLHCTRYNIVYSFWLFTKSMICISKWIYLKRQVAITVSLLSKAKTWNMMYLHICRSSESSTCW